MKVIANRFTLISDLFKSHKKKIVREILGFDVEERMDGMITVMVTEPVSDWNTVGYMKKKVLVVGANENIPFFTTYLDEKGDFTSKIIEVGDWAIVPPSAMLLGKIIFLPEGSNKQIHNVSPGHITIIPGPDITIGASVVNLQDYRKFKDENRRHLF